MYFALLMLRRAVIQKPKHDPTFTTATLYHGLPFISIGIACLMMSGFLIWMIFFVPPTDLVELMMIVAIIVLFFTGSSEGKIHHEFGENNRVRDAVSGNQVKL